MIQTVPIQIILVVLSVITFIWKFRLYKKDDRKNNFYIPFLVLIADIGLFNLGILIDKIDGKLISTTLYNILGSAIYIQTVLTLLIFTIYNEKHLPKGDK